MGEGFRFPVKEVQSGGSTQPKIILTVHIDLVDAVSGLSYRVFRITLVVLEGK
jgi:hypothetical protein